MIGRTLKVALLVGSDSQRPEQVRNASQLTNVGSTDAYRLADLPTASFSTLLFPRNYFRQRIRHNLGNYDLLLNLVTDADQNPTILGIIERAVRGGQSPVLNAPGAVASSTRASVAARLHGIDGLVIPRVCRLGVVNRKTIETLLANGTLRLPCILRKAGSHGGAIIALLSTADDLGRLPDGLRQCTLTEYVDFRSADGLYRKYRTFNFGGESIFRHLLISDSWNIHARDRERFMMQRPELLTESQAMYQFGIRSLPEVTRTTLDAIHWRLGLDFYGVDFGILQDRRMVLFEANATMNFFPISTDPRLAEMRKCVPPARRAFTNMILNAVAKRRSLDHSASQ